MDLLTQDLRHAILSLLKTPAFTFVALLTLALGIGGNTAIFGLVNAVLLRPLPFRAPGRLVWVWSTRPDRDKAFFSIPDFEDVRDQNHTLEEIAAVTNWGANITGAGEAERVLGARVSARAFPMLGLEPALGRTLVAADDRPGSARTVMLSYGLWKRRFGGGTGVTASQVTLNGDPYQIVGVLPRDFVLPGTIVGTDVVVPLRLDADSRREERGTNFLRVFARLKPGVTVHQAQQDLAAINLRLRQQYPEINGDKTTPHVVSLRDEIVGGYQRALMMLFSAVGLLLMIACSNLASLLLARASTRQRELAIRAAMGASRARLARQLFTESALLAMLGGALGLALAMCGGDLLLALSPADLPRAHESGIDDVVLGFTLGVSLLAALGVGLLPALGISRTEPGRQLNSEGRGAGDGASRTRARGVLVTVQVALSLMLLIAAGLFVRSFQQLSAVNPGFDPSHLVAIRLSLPASRYSTPEAVTGFYERLAQRLGELPGVETVSAASWLPLSAALARADFTIVGRPPLSASERPSAQNRWVSPGYFRAMGILLLAGREFTARDRAGNQPVVAIDEAFARRFWPNGNPLGAHLRINDASPDPPRDVEVVGVVRSVKHFTLEEDPLATVYAPILQVPQGAVSFLANGMSIALRTRSKIADLTPALRSEVGSLDPGVPASSAKSLADFVADAVAPRRFSLQLIGIFALVALLLSATGLYALVSYSVSRRRHEIGVRMALGARPDQVWRMVVGQGLKLASMGVVVGLIAALMVARFLSGLLFGVSSTDPGTIATACLTLIGVALLACFVPARHATRVSPAIALRGE